MRVNSMYTPDPNASSANPFTKKNVRFSGGAQKRDVAANTVSTKKADEEGSILSKGGGDTTEDLIKNLNEQIETVKNNEKLSDGAKKVTIENINKQIDELKEKEALQRQLDLVKVTKAGTRTEEQREADRDAKARMASIESEAKSKGADVSISGKSMKTLIVSKKKKDEGNSFLSKSGGDTTEDIIKNLNEQIETVRNNEKLSDDAKKVKIENINKQIDELREQEALQKQQELAKVMKGDTRTEEQKEADKNAKARKASIESKAKSKGADVSISEKSMKTLINAEMAFDKAADLQSLKQDKQRSIVRNQNEIEADAERQSTMAHAGTMQMYYIGRDTKEAFEEEHKSVSDKEMITQDFQDYKKYEIDKKIKAVTDTPDFKAQFQYTEGSKDAFAAELDETIQSIDAEINKTIGKVNKDVEKTAEKEAEKVKNPNAEESAAEDMPDMPDTPADAPATPEKPL